MNPHTEAWKRLAAAAQRAPEPRDELAPNGFATRIAARAFEVQAPALSSLMAHFSWRALGVATLLMAVTLITCQRGATTVVSGDEEAAYTDPVTEILELTS